jgi:ribose/xylose/arabinose/galactoside ABC-type transport system permease subunit
MAALAGGIAVRTADHGLVAALLIATAAGVGIGALQGGVLAKLGIASVVFTIGTMLGLQGLAFLVSDNAALPLEDFSVSDPLLNRWSFLSPNSLIAIAVFCVIWFLLALTKIGRELYAVGGGRREAAAAGVSQMRVMIFAFAVCGGCAALAGALASMKGGSSNPGGYTDLLLIAPAAILVGGIKLDGGRGTVLNVVLGVAIISVVRSGLGFRGVESYIVDLAVGGLLLVFVVADFFIEGAASRRSRDRTARRALVAQ